ncbi:hypothetical protein C2845_PM17G08060 [Panicum miliaceum]|uniref:AB hydrolase-1 domain-containing protein n=1 Tax=Panicum miliaceum TaxID=4540 RepID=A0A3L6Q2N9_PANMI|nr:hypothetical protein C2845_PM17G08060 [Panicum miliaceum]
MAEPAATTARCSGFISATHIFLVHGVCHGGWCWYKVVARLRRLRPPAAGRVVALDLAASGADGRQLREVPTFRDYTAPLLDALRSLPDGERAVLVGHSLGGLSVALAAEEFPDKVAAAVFLCAFMRDCTSPPGHALLQIHKGANRESQVDNETKPQDRDGKLPASFMFGPQFTAQNVYQLCSKEDITLAKSLMRIGSVFLEDLQAMEPLSMDRYGSVRKVYIVCKQDRTLPEEFQVDGVPQPGG